MIKERKSIIGIFENVLFAEVAKRKLGIAGISSTILNHTKVQKGPLQKQLSDVSLLVPFAQIEEAKKILKIKSL